MYSVSNVFIEKNRAVDQETAHLIFFQVWTLDTLDTLDTILLFYYFYYFILLFSK